MTDYSLIKAELETIMSDSSELEKYDSFINASADCFSSMIIDEANQNDPAIVHLCATMANLQIMLCRQSDDVTTFKAGDVSFTKDTSALDSARELYDLAYKACSNLLNTGSFAFKAV